MKRLFLLMYAFSVSSFAQAITLGPGETIRFACSTGHDSKNYRTKLYFHNQEYDLGPSLEIGSRECHQLELDVMAITSALKNKQSVDLAIDSPAGVSATAQKVKSIFSDSAKMYIEALEFKLQQAEDESRNCTRGAHRQRPDSSTAQ
jgi:hypothetical protein